MQIEINSAHIPLPTPRAFLVNMTLYAFKGRKNLQIHLYRYNWCKEEENLYPWEDILASLEGDETSIENAKMLVLESFTREERDLLIEYLKKRYSSRIKQIVSGPLSFPIPLGLLPLNKMPEDENLGRIYLDKAPNYPLDFQVRGFYDLNSASPLMNGQ
ncbi:MAG: hypothetical protein Q9M37_01190 [Desulfonauticus sp.]|nr:hypothetical protein [Desulfonauticus sp.]